MQSQELLNAIDDYYKLKEKYEKKYNEEKMKIIKNPNLSTKEKKLSFQQMKKLCIKCKQPGGTIFTNSNNKLMAVCGHTVNPCKLNIDIDKGSYKTSRDLAIMLDEIIEEEKSKIIRIKLDFLFGYISEETAVAEFNKLKSNLVKSSESQKNIETKYLNIVDNKEKKSALDNINIELHKSILEIKELHKNYLSTKNEAFIKSMVEIYISKILNDVKTIRQLKYYFNDVEKIVTNKDETNYLIQKQYTIEQLELALKQGKVNSNKK
jgi:hypothetical protein